MNDTPSTAGIILRCTRDGIITDVLQDTLGLDSNRLPGRPFAELAIGDGLRKALSFIASVVTDDAAYNHGFYARRNGTEFFLHVTGYAMNNHLIVIGAGSRVGLSELYHRTLRMHHDELNELNAELNQLQTAQSDREREYLSYVDKLKTQINRLNESLETREAELRAAQALGPAAEALEAARQDEAQRQADTIAALQAELARLREAKTALMQSEAAYATIFQSSPAATCIMSSLSGRIVNVSASFKDAIGYNADEVIDQSPSLFLSRASQDAIARAIQTLGEETPSRSVAIGFKRKDGEAREGIMWLRLMPLPDGNGAAEAPSRRAVVATLADTTEHARAIHQLNSDLNTLREQYAVLTDDLQQRAYQFKNRLGSGSDAVDVSQVEFKLYQQREDELKLEVKTLRHAEQELTAQVDALHKELARLSADAEHHRQMLAGYAPNLRGQAETLESLLAEIHSAETAHAEELSASRQREASLQQQADLLQVRINELELLSERYRELLSGKAALLRENAGLMEQIAQQFRFQTVPPAGASAVGEPGALLPAAELQQQRDANRTLAEELAAAHQHAHAETRTLAEQLDASREQAGLLEVELGRRVQRQQELSALVAGLRESEQKLRAQVRELHEQLAARDAQIAAQIERHDALLTQMAAQERAGHDAAAQLATLRGEVMLRDIEINRLKSVEPQVEAPRGQRHQALRALGMRLRRAKPPEAEAVADTSTPVAAAPTAPPESIVLAASSDIAAPVAVPSVPAPAPLPAATETHQLRLMLATEQALREELSAMHQREQSLNRQIAELDRQVRVLEWQRDDQSRLQPAVAATPASATTVIARANPHAASEFAALALALAGNSSLLKALTVQISEQMNAAGACLLLWAGDQRALLPCETHGLYDRPATAMPFDPALNPPDRSALMPEHHINEQDGVFATLSVPVRDENHAHGMLVLTFDAAHAPGSDEIQQAEALAQTLALALSQARRREQEQRSLATMYSRLEQARRINQQLAAGADPSRQRLAEMLQAGVRDNLTMLSAGVLGLADGLPPESAALVLARAESINSLVDEVTRSILDVVYELHPPLLETHGLSFALRWYAMRFAERTGVPTTVRCDDPAPALAPNVAQTLFRITQEALTNIDRPNPAFPIRITLSGDDALARLTITGSQSGVPAGAWERFRLQDRVDSIGGQYRIEVTEGQMTRVVVEVQHA